MGLNYTYVLWNPNKRVYDYWIAGAYGVYLLLFIGLSFAFNPEMTPETVLIRAFGTLAIAVLHVILAIGPLSRLNTVFLPLLYNRRHLGVSMFLAGLIHAVLAIVQFHTLGITNPLSAIFTSNTNYGSLLDFPFQTLGFLALLILFVMASTSHDFFLKNLSPKVWKALHMGVYLAYFLLLMHVALGVFQQEGSWGTAGILAGGFLILSTLHLRAGMQEFRVDNPKEQLEKEGWYHVGRPDEIQEDRAKIFTLQGERVAIFKYQGKLSAVHNYCKHQGGPLGEGKIVDGCITCPWHGYQYLPGNGQSPPPFTETVHTYRLKLVEGEIYIHSEALPEGTPVEPLTL